MEKESLNTKKGFSLVEAVIAVGIFSIITGYSISVMISSHKYVSESGNQYRATALAEEGLEAARNIRDNAFANLVDNTYGISSSGSTYAFSGSQDTKDIFTRKVYVSTIDSLTKEIKSEITWQDKGISKNVTLSERLTNWRKTKATSGIAKWPLDDNSGCTAHDSIGSNDGTLRPNCSSDSPTWTTGKVNSALRFDGSNDYVQISNSSSLGLTTSGTIMAWFNATSLGNNLGIVHKGAATNGSDESYFMYIDNGRKFAGGCYSGSQTTLRTTTNLSTNQWYLGTFVWDSTGMYLYLNGVLMNSNTTVLNCRVTTGSLQIGSRYTSGTRNTFNGVIDEVVLYNTALSASEILTIYNSQK